MQRTAATSTCHFASTMFSSWFSWGTQLSTWNVLILLSHQSWGLFPLQDITNWT